MKYLHQKINGAILDRKKIFVENQTYPDDVDDDSSLCKPACYLIFVFMILMVGLIYV